MKIFPLLAGVALFLLLASGTALAVYFNPLNPAASLAFITHQVNQGWLVLLYHRVASVALLVLAAAVVIAALVAGAWVRAAVATVALLVLLEVACLGQQLAAAPHETSRLLVLHIVGALAVLVLGAVALRGGKYACTAQSRADQAAGLALFGLVVSLVAFYGTPGTAFRHIDDASAQRGFLVYSSVCAGCHGLSAVHYRDLAGIGLSTDQIAVLAKGQDGFKSPAVLNFGGAVPPDLSDIVAQRPEGYVAAFLTGYAAAPSDVTLAPGHSYNAAYPGNQTAMPNVLQANAVTYADGTVATQAQEAADVAEFLTWADDPNLTVRHQIGLRAVIFFAFLSVIALFARRQRGRADLH